MIKIVTLAPEEDGGLVEYLSSHGVIPSAAQIYMLTAHLPRVNTIKDEDMVKLVKLFGLSYRKDFLNL